MSETNSSNNAQQSSKISPRVKKALEDLQKIAAGIIYDGRVDGMEIFQLKRWLSLNDDLLVGYPLKDLKELFNNIMEDGVVTNEERQQLLKFLRVISAKDESRSEDHVKFTEKPSIDFEGKNFVLLGKMRYTTRRNARNTIRKNGGKVVKYIRLDTDYLIIGDIISSIWLNAYQSKLDYAYKINIEENGNIQIIKESDFVKSVIEFTE